MHIHIEACGTKIRVKDRMFHFFHEEEERKLSPSKVESLSLAPQTSLSSEVVHLAVEESIPIYFTDKLGRTHGQIWSYRYGSIATIRKHQALFPFSNACIERVKATLIAKIEYQARLLLHLFRNHSGKASHIRQVAEELRAYGNRIKETRIQDPKELNERLRGYEGSAARLYFQTLGKALPSPYSFEKRSRRPATDPFNAVLNYLYGILYGKVENALIQAGLDPYLGYYHRDEYDRPSLAYDMVEPFRPWADAVAYRLCVDRALEPTQFEEKKEGLWLGKTGKEVVIPAFREFLEKKVHRKGRRVKREQHVQEEAKGFARYLLESFDPGSVI